MAPASVGATSALDEDSPEPPGPGRSLLSRAAIVAAAVMLLAAAVGLLATQVTSGGPRAGVVTMGAETPATAMDSRVLTANNSPMVLADPTDGRFVVMTNRVDAPDYTCSLQLSGDAGATWRPADPVPTLPPEAEKCFGGDIAFDRNGRLYFSFMGLAGGGNTPVGAYLTTSSDRGRTFSAPQRVVGPLNFAVSMAIDTSMGARGRIHLAWLHASSDPPNGGFAAEPNPIFAAYSDDGGATFSTPVQVSDPARARVLAPTLALGGDHHVHVAYYDVGDDARDYQALEGPAWDGKWSLVVATSTNGGRSFAPGVVADADIVAPQRVIAALIMPPAALAARDDLVCLAWADARNGDPDVVSRCSGDGARHWRPAVRVNDDVANTGLWQYMPGLAIAPGGRLDVTFYDRRHDLHNLNNDIFYTFSRDGGRSFAPNVQLNRGGSSISVVGQQYTAASADGLWDFGARMGLLSRRNDVLAAWADTRNSSPETTAQDIFTTVVRPPTPARGVSPGAVLAGVALLAAGVGILALGRRRRSARSAALAPAGAALRATQVVLCAVVLAGCGSSSHSARSSSSLPAPVPVFTVNMKEYSLDVSGPLPAGRVVFRFANVGAEQHEPILVALDEGLPPIDAYIAKTDRPDIVGFANVWAMAPQMTGTFAVDLQAGHRYALICLSKAPDGTAHYDKGETWETRAEGQSPPTTAAGHS